MQKKEIVYSSTAVAITEAVLLFVCISVFRLLFIVLCYYCIIINKVHFQLKTKMHVVHSDGCENLFKKFALTKLFKFKSCFFIA